MSLLSYKIITMNKLVSLFTAQSMKQIGIRILFTLRRFGLELLLLFAIICFNLYFNLVEGFTEKISFIAFVALVADAAMVLWSEQQKNKLKATLLRVGVVLLCVAYACINIFWLSSVRYTEQLIWLILAVIMLLPFLGVGRQKDDVPAFHFILKLMGSGIKAGIVFFVLLFAVSILILIIDGLFGITLALQFVPWCLWPAFFVFCYAVPHGARRYNYSLQSPAFFKGIAFYVILPFLLLYMLIVWVYLFYILFRWELPQGTVAWAVSAVMAAYLSCYALLYPYLMKNKSGKLYLLMTKVLPLGILPLLILMTVGVVRRVSDYGITVGRLYLITALVFYYVVCITIPLLKTPRFRWIFISVAVIILLTSVQPMDYHQICKRVFVSEIRQKMADGIDPEADEQLREKIYYVSTTFGASALNGIVPDDVIKIIAPWTIDVPVQTSELPD